MSYRSKYDVLHLKTFTADYNSLYLYIYRKKIVIDVEGYVKPLKWIEKRKKEREKDVIASRRVIKVALCMWMSLLIAGLDRCCIYNTGEGWINAYLMCKEARMQGQGCRTRAGGGRRRGGALGLFWGWRGGGSLNNQRLHFLFTQHQELFAFGMF